MFCRDMDDNLREMGVGDLTVPKTMRKLGEAFYGRLDVYDRALGERRSRRTRRGARPQHAGAGGARRGGARLAAYVRAAAARLEALPIAGFGDGKVSFPDPERDFRAGLRGPGMSAKAAPAKTNPVERSGSPR